MKTKDNLNLIEIKDIVQDAIKDRDFDKLNRNIKDFVGQALDGANKSININLGSRKSKNTFKHINKTSMESSTIKERSSKERRAYAVPVGKLSGLIFTILGIVGTGAFGISIFTMLILGGTIGGKPLFYGISLILLPLFVISLVALLNGNRIRNRLKRFQRYVLKLGKRNYCPIEELALSTRLNHKSAVKDLSKMIDVGMFPQGHIDKEETYFMINNETYDQYLKLQEGIKNKKAELVEEKIHDRDSEVKGAIDQGRTFILQIKNANVDIPGEEISKKLYRLENVTEKIFDYVELHPAKLPEIKKFIEYFLPTTLKLVETYKNIDSNPIQGENILKTKSEIEETIDTINLAFEKLLDELFEDTAMDISTDISVLETMLAQEGLTDNDMRVNKEKRENKNGQ